VKIKNYTAHIPAMEKFVRAAIHVPAGMIGAFLTIFPPFGWIFWKGFETYELNEDGHLKDGAYLDIFGWLIGFALGALTILVVLLIVIKNIYIR